jgi:nicotinamide N-methyltransferase
MATLIEHPSVVVVTDHPDKTIFENLEKNVAQNRHSFQSGCSVHCYGHEWGQDVGALL